MFFLAYGLPASLCYQLLPFMFASSIWQFFQLLLTLRTLNLVSVDASALPKLRVFRLAEEFSTFFINIIPLRHT